MKKKPEPLSVFSNPTTLTDEIDRLRAELAWRTEERDRYKTVLDATVIEVEEMRAELAERGLALRQCIRDYNEVVADNDKLRAELAECREEKKMTRFDPEEFELHAAQEYARKMARERDEARVMADKLAAELAACAAVLPGAYYMDQPDGGDVPVSEQLRRLAQDAERYRYLRRKVAIVGAQFHFLNLPLPVHVVAPIAAVEFDAVLDVERNARPVARPPTPVGWSDTDWIKHLHEQQHPLSALHINRGSMDAAADAYEAEYNAAQESRRIEFDAEMRPDAFGPKHG